MRELGIFQNKCQLDNSGNIMLHQDDMPVYNTWFLTCFHFVDEVIYRGPSSEAPKNIPNLSEGLAKLNQPKNIIITTSKQDTY